MAGGKRFSAACNRSLKNKNSSTKNNVRKAFSSSSGENVWKKRLETSLNQDEVGYSIETRSVTKLKKSNCLISSISSESEVTSPLQKTKPPNQKEGIYENPSINLESEQRLCDAGNENYPPTTDNFIFNSTLGLPVLPEIFEDIDIKKDILEPLESVADPFADVLGICMQIQNCDCHLCVAFKKYYNQFDDIPVQENLNTSSTSNTKKESTFAVPVSINTSSTPKSCPTRTEAHENLHLLPDTRLVLNIPVQPEGSVNDPGLRIFNESYHVIQIQDSGIPLFGVFHEGEIFVAIQNNQKQFSFIPGCLPWILKEILNGNVKVQFRNTPVPFETTSNITSATTKIDEQQVSESMQQQGCMSQESEASSPSKEISVGPTEQLPGPGLVDKEIEKKQPEELSSSDDNEGEGKNQNIPKAPDETQQQLPGPGYVSSTRGREIDKDNKLAKPDTEKGTGQLLEQSAVEVIKGNEEIPASASQSQATSPFIFSRKAVVAPEKLAESGVVVVVDRGEAGNKNSDFNCIELIEIDDDSDDDEEPGESLSKKLKRTSPNATTESNSCKRKSKVPVRRIRKRKHSVPNKIDSIELNGEEIIIDGASAFSLPIESIILSSDDETDCANDERSGNLKYDSNWFEMNTVEVYLDAPPPEAEIVTIDD